MSQIYLGVNVDHIATVRQARGTNYPCPIHAALDAEMHGADGITLHLREDRRHIQDDDVFRMRPLLKTRMNLEMAVTAEMLEIALKVKPYYCCLVPEKREELTTEGGLDVVKNFSMIKEAVDVLQSQGTMVSLFIDPSEIQINAAFDTGAKVIELHTGAYAEETSMEKQRELLHELELMAHFAHKKGLIVNAGHGLHEHNVKAVAKIPVIHELNIGHALVAKALVIGFGPAVREIKQLMVEARA